MVDQENHDQTKTQNFHENGRENEDTALENVMVRRPSVSLSIPLSSVTNTKTSQDIHNPWAVQCQKSRLHKLLGNQDQHGQEPQEKTQSNKLAKV